MGKRTRGIWRRIATKATSPQSSPAFFQPDNQHALLDLERKFLPWEHLERMTIPLLKIMNTFFTQKYDFIEDFPREEAKFFMDCSLLFTKLQEPWGNENLLWCIECSRPFDREI